MGAIAYSVRRSERARHARVVVTAEAVELVVPRRMPLRQAAALVHEKRGWIERTRERFRRAERDFPPPRLEDGAAIPYLGRELRLRVRTEPGRTRPRVRHVGETLEVVVGRAGGEVLRSAIESWYRRRARLEVERRLDEAVGRAGGSYARLAIRDQRTRWGSCSPTGTLSFSWRLLLAPERVLQYVIEHEVAHLSVPDHSPRFWRLLAQRLPGFREQERWLRLHGASLRL